MSDLMTAAPAAGWYPDPISEQLLRWWDGAGWQEQTLPRLAATTAAKPSRAVSFAQSRFAPQTSGESTPAPADVLAPIVIAPLQLAPDPEPEPATASTGGGWALAFSPWIGMLLLAVGIVAFAGVGSSPVSAGLPAVIGGIALLLAMAFALRDGRSLAELGHTRRPSVWWIALGPLGYLIARTARVGDAAPLTWLVINSVVACVVAAVLVALLAPALLGSI